MLYELEPFLDKYDIRYNGARRGNQAIKCPNADAHKSGDSHPSASVHLDRGLWNCLACGAGGSAVDLVMTIEGVDIREALHISETVAAGDSREIPPGGDGQRNSVGLPRGPRYRNKPKGATSPWSGFRT